MECGLYACDASKTDGTLFAITTVTGKKKMYSDLDCRRAERARKLQDTMGYPSVKKLLHMIDNNLILNCPVTRRDVIMAQDIFGPNVNEIKGKNVRRQPGMTDSEYLQYKDDYYMNKAIQSNQQGIT